jgi:ABC-2 type transport system ATP-binding protein
MPSSGTARIAGFSITEQPNQIRKLIGYLPDTPPLYNEMTVESYLRFVGRLKDVKREDLTDAVDRVVRLTDITSVKGVRLGELSHGYRQRVAISHALIHDPKVLILDEPINGLDPVQIVEMRDLIVSLKGRYTVILSSHILSEITKTCDRILIVDQGKLVAEGSEADLEKRISGQMKLICETLIINEALLSSLSNISQVIQVEHRKSPNETHLIHIQASGDIRAEVSQAIVSQGGGLLSLTGEKAGLEALFLKLVQTSQRVK